ncbi:MAG: MFS transporter [Brevefilum sp.]|nr:MFS transporter [Brevefilum sp.]MDW7755211.1 MFS transporter [Brevefilum sp.]
MDRQLRWYDYITINIYYFALTARSQTLTPLILPLLVQFFMGEEGKGAAYGNLRLWSLMIAVLMQGFIGMVSDHSTSRFGRRRPFILIGAVTEVLVFIGIGVIAATLEGEAGYWALFAATILSMLSANTGHAAVQGLIPDIVPESKHGIFSGFKAFFELPAPLIFVSFVITKFVENENIWGALLVLSSVVLICTAIAMFAPEKPIKKPPYEWDWQPVIRLLGMTIAFTAVILGSGALVNYINSLSANLSDLPAKIMTAAVGVLGMVLAVVVGVWGSIRISLGGKADVDRNSFTWWVVNRLAFLVGSTNLASFALYFIQERFSNLQGAAAAGPTAMLVMFVGVAILISSIPAGWLTDKFGRKPVCAFSGVLAMIGTIIVVSSPNMTVLYVGGLLVGIAIGFFYSASWALGTALVPREEAGRYLGIQNLAGAGAGAIGAYIGGPIGDGVGFTVLLSIFGFLFLISTLALFGIKEKALAVN